MKVNKGNVGYIRYKKMLQSVIILVFIAAGLSLFFICKTVLKTPRNLGTVFAVLLVLPATKALVNLILFLPYRSTDKAFADKALQFIGDSDKAYFDCVFTSPQNLMHLDFIGVKCNEIVCYSSENKKTDIITKYLSESLKKQGVDVHVHVFLKQQDVLRRLSDLPSGDIAEETKAFIRTILV